MEKEEKILGKHYLVDLYMCDQDLINDLELVKNILHRIIEKVGAKLVSEGYKVFIPHGISGFAIISESHISIHTWPEYSFVAIDIFSCNKNVADEICDYIQKEFKAERYNTNCYERGIINN